MEFVDPNPSKSVDDYTLEVLVTVALVVVGYSIALNLHLSGPLAMVVAGLFIGNQGRLFAMSETTKVFNEAGEVVKPGRYITKDTILEIYDALAESVKTGTPYQTRLDPPPAAKQNTTRDDMGHAAQSTRYENFERMET